MSKKIETITQIVQAIADIGYKHPLMPLAKDIEPFKKFFTNGNLDKTHLDDKDGCCTRRELLARFLLLCAVLDQGPDISGVRDLLTKVVNKLYENEIRIFHTPLDFFQEMQVSVREIWDNHEKIKNKNAANWARINLTTEGRYNLFMDGGKQSLNYAIFRWGTPLALPYILTKESEEENRPTALIDYLEKWSSAEKMSQELKDDNIYGLGKAIGDKACHLYAKWIVSSFALTQQNNDEWGEYSFECPYDSNAGRVLWRTGYLLHLAKEEEYKQKKVIQSGQGKKGLAYIRVTNIRGMKVSCELPSDVFSAYQELCVNHLKTHKKSPKKVETQRLQHVFLMSSSKSVAAFDDGLIHIGREYCHNHEKPDCGNCPLKEHCEGFQSNQKLIKEYRT